MAKNNRAMAKYAEESTLYKLAHVNQGQGRDKALNQFG